MNQHTGLTTHVDKTTKECKNRGKKFMASKPWKKIEPLSKDMIDIDQYFHILKLTICYQLSRLYCKF